MNDFRATDTGFIFGQEKIAEKWIGFSCIIYEENTRDNFTFHQFFCELLLFYNYYETKHIASKKQFQTLHEIVELYQTAFFGGVRVFR